MHADPRLVSVRRWKRRLKAVASIAVAVCAGVFLACGKTTKPPTDAEADVDATTARDRESAATEDATADVGAADAIVADAKSDALATPRRGPRDAAVDVREHRKGMPVPDNLLE